MPRGAYDVTGVPYTLRRPVFGPDVPPKTRSPRNLITLNLDGQPGSNDDLSVGSSSDDESTSGDADPDRVTRARQREIFQAFVDEQSRTLTLDQVQKAATDTDHDVLSTRQLLEQQGGATKIITSPREYQMELFYRAKEKNIVAILETGSGKTLIAVMLLRHIVDEELARRERGEKKRIAFFLVDSVTLVFQQAKVLEVNLDYSIERLYGSMSADLWSKKPWGEYFEKNMIIVCTAEILHHCLMHSFIKMDEINILIFDEAHHAKKGHPYAKVITDYYVPSPEATRPRIFGMTASPVDAKNDVLGEAQRLEALLHSEIATISDPAMLQSNVATPEEIIVGYDRPLFSQYTALHTRIKAVLGDLQSFRSMSDTSRSVCHELGPWAGDWFWKLALDEGQTAKAECQSDRTYQKQGIYSVEALDAEIAILRAASEIASSHKFLQPSLDANLSDKVAKLHHVLEKNFWWDTDAKCIVFVDRRITAQLLHEIFSFPQFGGKYLRCGILVGGGSKPGAYKQSVNKQFLSVTKFRNGEINCLFATSVAEEGLDIPDCNIVIRFDLPKNMIQNIQSRGRARRRDSKMVYMVLNGTDQEQLVQDLRGHENQMKAFCHALPEDRKINLSFDTEAGMEKSYVEKTTGAKLTHGMAMIKLQHFAAVLPKENNEPSLPVYLMHPRGGAFACEIILPQGSPVRRVLGKSMPRKIDAKRAAAFRACLELRNRGALDDRFLPLYHSKVIPKMANALLAVSSKNRGTYDMRVKPEVWSWGYSIPITVHYLTILEIKGPTARNHRPIGLVTRRPMPQFSSFPLYLMDGSAVTLEPHSLSVSVDFSWEQLLGAKEFTLRMFKDLFNKKFEDCFAKMSYHLVPLVDDPTTKIRDGTFENLVDWALLKHVMSNKEIKWSPQMLHDELVNRFLVDPWDGSRRFFSVEIDPTKKPTDPVPEACRVRPRYNNSILDYSVSLWKNSRAKLTLSADQPVLRCERVLHRLNALAEPSEKERSIKTQAYLCPEPLRISAIPADYATTLLLFPAIIHRIEDYLIALEAASMVGINISPSVALEAVTKDSDHSDKHEREKIEFRPGMGNNYERLEFMGDCFLKMATSISLYCVCPEDDEFSFHVKRMILICNQNLLHTANEMKLFEYARTLAFSRRLWYPKGLALLEGKKTGEEVVRHKLSDKSIADICEALIGAAFIEHHRPGEPWDPKAWDEAVLAVTKLTMNPYSRKKLNDEHMHIARTFDDYKKSYIRPKWLDTTPNAAQRDLVEKAFKEHPYRFRNARLLRCAFTHASMGIGLEGIPSYQRLEFLGDSLLDLACVEYLFYKYPTKDPQWLTEHKMAMVSNQFLGALCVKLGFHRHLRHNNSMMQRDIQEYVKDIEAAEADAHGAPDYWVNVKAAPKYLPDIVEAYVGALFIDADFDYGPVAAFFARNMRPYFEDMSLYDAFAQSHPTVRLHALLSQDLGCRAYGLMASELPHALPGVELTDRKTVVALVVHETVVAHATAASGRNAKVAASRRALEVFQGVSPTEFRITYGCDCPREAGDKGVKGEEMGTAC